MDRDIGTFITLEDAATEVGRICNAYKDEDIDLTVLLTHIGFESDKELAAMLDPAWGVDLIIGGHSHTILDRPAVVNNVLIVQAGVGTDQIGRFDITVDDETNAIVEWQWRLIPVDDRLAEPDPELQRFIESYKETVDRKYATLICRFPEALTHPRREEETALGNLFADLFAERSGADVVMVGSGSIRSKSLGPTVTLGELYTAFPYDDVLYKCTITGAQLRRIFAHIMRPENRTSEGECYQVNRGVRAVYNEAERRLESLTVRGTPVADEGHYTVLLQGYHYTNSGPNIGLTAEDLTALAPPKVVSTSARDVLEEYLRSHQGLQSQVEGRLVYR